MGEENFAIFKKLMFIFSLVFILSTTKVTFSSRSLGQNLNKPQRVKWMLLINGSLP